MQQNKNARVPQGVWGHGVLSLLETSPQVQGSASPQPSTCLGVRGRPGGGVRGPNSGAYFRKVVSHCNPVFPLVNAAQRFRGWEGEGKMCVWSSPSYIFFRFAETKQLPLTWRMSCFLKKEAKIAPKSREWWLRKLDVGLEVTMCSWGRVYTRKGPLERDRTRRQWYLT